MHHKYRRYRKFASWPFVSGGRTPHPLVERGIVGTVGIVGSLVEVGTRPQGTPRVVRVVRRQGIGAWRTGFQMSLAFR